jgi:multidrug transporter EmrE-like cation transporter
MMFILILCGVVLNAIAQLFLKHGMNQVGHFSFVLDNIFPIAWKVMTTPAIVGGLFCYVLSVVFWLLVLSRVDVSYAYPMLSIGYIVNAFGAHFFLNEELSLMRMLAILVIMLGIFLLTRTAS